jgi:hypothetical protein
MGDRLDVLVTLVEAWEAEHYPFDLPDPIEAITAETVKVWRCGFIFLPLISVTAQRNLSH